MKHVVKNLSDCKEDIACIAIHLITLKYDARFCKDYIQRTKTKIFR